MRYPYSFSSDLLSALQLGKYNRKVYFYLFTRLYCKGRCEVIGLKIGAVKDYPLFSYLISSKGAGGDLGHEKLLYDLNSDTFRRTIEDYLAITYNPYTFKAVETCS